MGNIVIIGSSGAIGAEFKKQLESQHNVICFVRSDGNINFDDEDTIEQAANTASQHGPLDMVIVATGLLHGNGLMPEKSLKELSSNKMEQIFKANTIGPALVMKHFLPLLNKDKRSIFAALSARVGSISDNHLGGWYSYRASKAALNMLIKTGSIELARTNKNAVIVGLHPGTVNSGLSKPFQGFVKPGKLFEASYAAKQLIQVLNNLKPEQTGKCFAYDGSEIPA